MVGPEITTALRLEIQNYLGIPYFINKPGNPRTDNASVGKGDAKQIALATIEAANQQGIKLLEFDHQQLYNFQKKNRIGIDCSGLAYHLLNKMSLLIREKGIEDDLIGTEGKKGVRRVNADLMTCAPNAVPVKSYDDIQTGDLIRLDGGKHVIFIIEKVGSDIHYVHSSSSTKIRGVHYGIITITDPSGDLGRQTWSDHTKTGKPYSTLFNTSQGDGIFRLSIFL